MTVVQIGGYMSERANERRKKISEKQLALRQKLWPDINDNNLWLRTKSDGFITIPRLMPLILQIMDELSKGKPVSLTYLEIWCRSFDECFITLNKQDELAFCSGFKGQRALSTWRNRLQILKEIGFIDIKSGPSGPMSYALLLNPYNVIKNLYEKNQNLINEDTFNALYARAIDIGANDLD
jgi:hypothetical protein